MAAPYATSTAMAATEEFTLDLAADRTKSFDTLLFKGRHVADVEARVIEAQFRRPDGSTLLFLNDDTAFKEVLTLVLVGPSLAVLDQVTLGGAFTPGYLTAVYPATPDEVVFCWHDLDQAVTVARYPRWFGLRAGWLKTRELGIRAPSPVRIDAVTLADIVPRLRWPSPRRARRVGRRGRIVPSLAWLAWLTIRTLRLDRRSGPRRRKP